MTGSPAHLLARSALLVAVSAAVVPVYKEPFHRPVFVNAQVRVLDVVLPPHGTSLFHMHADDLVGVIIAPGPGRSQVLGSEWGGEEDPGKPGDVWFATFPTPVTHRTTNSGETPIHYLVLELLGARREAGPDRAELRSPVVYENSRVRVSRFDLSAGASTPPHAHPGGHVLGALTAGELVPSVRVQPGFLEWGEADQHHVIRNAGKEPMVLIEFDVLP
jgi:quercetin dioxygenase-like cupin family protein